jgi:hypothetical protein
MKISSPASRPSPKRHDRPSIAEGRSTQAAAPLEHDPLDSDARYLLLDARARDAEAAVAAAEAAARRAADASQARLAVLQADLDARERRELEDRAREEELLCAAAERALAAVERLEGREAEERAEAERLRRLGAGMGRGRDRTAAMGRAGAELWDTGRRAADGAAAARGGLEEVLRVQVEVEGLLGEQQATIESLRVWNERDTMRADSVSSLCSADSVRHSHLHMVMVMSQRTAGDEREPAGMRLNTIIAREDAVTLLFLDIACEETPPEHIRHAAVATDRRPSRASTRSMDGANNHGIIA